MRIQDWQVVLVWFVLASSAVAQPEHVRLENSSDWWSYIRLEEVPPSGPEQRVTFQPRLPAESNFQVAGLTLDSASRPQIRAKFGDATEVERGDAASGRDQICYESPSGTIHLIFEWGEVDSVLYLFEGGRKWDGVELCARSAAVSSGVSMASGLRLGLTTEQVKAILGIPNTSAPDKLVYYFGVRKKATAKDLARLRKNNPDMSDKEFHESFDYSDVEAYIEARFASGKLDYLAISRSETY
jgi:hypothetical protein